MLFLGILSLYYIEKLKKDSRGTMGKVEGRLHFYNDPDCLLSLFAAVTRKFPRGGIIKFLSSFSSSSSNMLSHLSLDHLLSW